MIFLAILILPASAGLTAALADIVREYFGSCIFFILGACAYTMVYPVFRKPMYAYTIGHELSHILGIWIFGGKVHGLKINRGGGSVRTDKLNIWIMLAPYFFPLYAVSALALYFILSIFFEIERYYNPAVFVTGLLWAFHFWMTIHVTGRRQPDIKQTGIFFSVVAIYTANIAVLITMLALVSREMTVIKCAAGIYHHIQYSYLWIWHRLTHLIQQVYQMPRNN